MIDRTLIIFTLSFFSSLFNHSWASFAPVPVDAMKVTCKTVTGTSFDVTAEPSTSVRSRRAGQRRKILTKRERLKRNASLCSQKKKKKNIEIKNNHHRQSFFSLSPQISAVRALIEAAKPELSGDTLIVIHQGKVREKEKEKKREKLFCGIKRGRETATALRDEIRFSLFIFLSLAHSQPPLSLFSPFLRNRKNNNNYLKQKTDPQG